MQLMNWSEHYESRRVRVVDGEIQSAAFCANQMLWRSCNRRVLERPANSWDRLSASRRGSGSNSGSRGGHNLEDCPEGTPIPGLLIYRFDADLTFFNADDFKERRLKAIADSETLVEWVVVDASPIDVVNVSTVQRIDELREELAARGIVLAHAQAKRNLARFFRGDWITERREL